jgi:PAS domain S-box-containing protein
VIVTDERAGITDMNHIAESLTGWTLDDTRGELLSTVFNIVDEKRRDPVESPADKVRRFGTIVGLANHTILIRKDGVETPIDDSAAPIWDDDGKLTGIVLVFRDITERKLAEKATLRERTRALEVLQQAPVFFALLRGPDHVISMVNPLYLRLVNKRDVLNKPVRIALPDAAEEGYVEILDKVYQGEPFVGNGMHYHVDAGEGLPADDRYIDFVYQPLREVDDRVSGIILVGVDVTDRKKVAGRTPSACGDCRFLRGYHPEQGLERYRHKLERCCLSPLRLLRGGNDRRVHSQRIFTLTRKPSSSIFAQDDA